MSYEVKVRGKIGRAVQRVAEEEITAAIGQLTSLAERDVVHATHDARKHFKKVRALLRLVRDHLSKAEYRTEDACFRDLGRQLRELRDAQVLVRTLDDVRARFFDSKHPELIRHARELLAGDERRSLARLQGNKTVSDVVAALQAASGRVRQWKLDRLRWKQTCRAIQRSYKQARTAGRSSSDDPSDENLHEWRKRVKDLWYHARLLCRASPEFMKDLVRELDVLGEMLGADHDLAVLCGALNERRAVLKRPRELEAFQPPAARTYLRGIRSRRAPMRRHTENVCQQTQPKTRSAAQPRAEEKEARADSPRGLRANARYW